MKEDLLKIHPTQAAMLVRRLLSDGDITSEGQAERDFLDSLMREGVCELSEDCTSYVLRKSGHKRDCDSKQMREQDSDEATQYRLKELDDQLGQAGKELVEAAVELSALREGLRSLLRQLASQGITIIFVNDTLAAQLELTK